MIMKRFAIVNTGRTGNAFTLIELLISLAVTALIILTVAQLMKPFPQYTTVSRYRNNVGTTRYQGVELSLRHRLAHGLLYSIAYTRSKLVDDASSVFLVVDRAVIGRARTGGRGDR